MNVVLRSKVELPAVPPFAVRREGALGHLDEVWHRRLGIVRAPAGYGKTTLAATYCAGVDPDHLAWFSVDERDRDPIRFGLHLLAALDRLLPGVAIRARSELGGERPGLGDGVVDTIVDALEGVDHDVLLVLDDLDRVTEPIVADISRLLFEAPRCLHVLVTARSDPSLSLHRLRVRDDVVELRAADLRFDVDEIRSLVQRLSGLELDDAVAQHLSRVTEGWPVAVQLAALALRASGDQRTVATFDGTDRGIVDYLSAEILDLQSTAVREFLLETSVLDVLDADACDALTGNDDGAAILEDLDDRGLFVTRLAGEPGRFRHHRLLRGFLRHELRRRDGARLAELWRRAAAWSLERGDWDDASGHLIRAEAWDDLAALIKERGRDLFEQGRSQTVVDWIEALPPAHRDARPWVALTLAALASSQGAPETCAAAITEVDRNPLADDPAHRLGADVVQALLVMSTRPTPELGERTERALAGLDDFERAQASGSPPFELPDVLRSSRPPDLRCVVEWSAAQLRLLDCDGRALAHAVRAADSPASTPPALRVNASGTAALVLAVAGDLDGAGPHGTQAAGLAVDALGDHHAALVASLVADVVIARAALDLDTAAALGDDVLALATRWGRWPLAGYLMCERARIELLRGDDEAALAWVRRYRSSTPTGRSLVADGVAAAVEGLVRAHAAGSAGSGPVSGDDAGDVPASWDSAYARVTIAAATGDAVTARRYLGRWPDAAAPLGAVEHQLATALTEAAEGDDELALRRVRAVLAETAPTRNLSPWFLGGEAMRRLLDTVRGDARSPSSAAMAEAVLTACRPWRRRDHHAALLSDREREVLHQLPTRLSNAEIGEVLYVSTNTVKTHLKHIYQKLAVRDRDEAVERARELGLL